MHRNPLFIGSSYIGDAFFHMKDIMSETGMTFRGGTYGKSKWFEMFPPAVHLHKITSVGTVSSWDAVLPPHSSQLLHPCPHPYYEYH